MRTVVRRAVLGLTSLALVSGGTLVGSPAQAATPQAQSATSWLVDQLQDGLLQSEWGPQYGPSLDVVLALGQLDADVETRRQVLDAVEANIGSYIGSGGESYAGPTAKLLAVVQEEGTDPSTYADGRLLPRLRQLVHSTRDRQWGRVMDESQYGDYSNTITQSWAVRAFGGAEHRFVKRTTAFLVKQQCDQGFFRESMKGRDCETGRKKDLSKPSVDSTALAVMSLRAARVAGVPDLGDDIRSALRWLARKQNANGSFKGNGVANANTTGLAAWTLAGTKWDAAARKAAVWLGRRQVTAENSAGTALESEHGAVSYDKTSFEQGAEEGITEASRIQWAMATAQSAPALDLLSTEGPSGRVRVR